MIEHTTELPVKFDFDSIITPNFIDSLNNAESRHHDTFGPKLLLKNSFKLKFKKEDLDLTPFDSLYPGGANEPSSDIVATIEEIYIPTTSGGSGSNAITIAVTEKSAAIISGKINQTANTGDVTFTLVFPVDAIDDRQFYFRPVNTTEEGEWGTAFNFKSEAEFTTDKVRVLNHGSNNSVRYVQFNVMKAKQNFNISLATRYDDAKSSAVIRALTNNSKL